MSFSSISWWSELSKFCRMFIQPSSKSSPSLAMKSLAAKSKSSKQMMKYLGIKKKLEQSVVENAKLCQVTLVDSVRPFAVFKHTSLNRIKQLVFIQFHQSLTLQLTQLVQNKCHSFYVHRFVQYKYVRFQIFRFFKLLLRYLYLLIKFFVINFKLV